MAVTEAQINEMRWLRAQNLSIRLIAERVGVSRSTVGSYLLGEGEAFYEKACKGCGGEIFAFRPHKEWCSRACERSWKQANDPAYRERASAYRRERRARDEEYRVRTNAYKQAWRKRQRELRQQAAA